MLTFTPDDCRLLVANESERSPLVDPRGSVSICAVPEPGSRALMAGGLGLVGWLGRRRHA